MDELAEKIHRRCEKVFNSIERTNAEEQWQELAEYFAPNSSGTFLNNRGVEGAKKTKNLFDSEGAVASTTLASAIHATLTNPATRWSKIRYKEQELNDNEEAVAWVENANKLIHEAYNESNFDTQIAKCYQNLTSLSNMILLQEDMPGDEPGAFGKFNYTAIHLSEVAWQENSEGIVDSVYRKFELTPKQAIDKFGEENVSQEIRENFIHNPTKKHKFVHAIYPRDKGKVEFNELNLAQPNKRPFASIYIDAEEREVVAEDGFYEFPMFVARWSTSPREEYGTGPANIALPEVRSLNKLNELSLEALAIAIHPPTIAEQRSILGTLDRRPKRLTIVRNINGIKDWETKARFDVGGGGMYLKGVGGG